MRRLLAPALIVGLGLGFGLVLPGCGEKSEVKQQTVTEGPGGKTTETDTKQIKQSGENPPAPTGDPGAK